MIFMVEWIIQRERAHAAPAILSTFLHPCVITDHLHPGMQVTCGMCCHLSIKSFPGLEGKKNKSKWETFGSGCQIKEPYH